MISAPIRFFCRRCNQMIQIGAQMTGRAVICPQCGERVVVPPQSVPQAEALYQFLKRKKAAEKAAKDIHLPRSVPAPQTLSNHPANPVQGISTQNKEQKQVEEEQDSPLNDLNADDVDRWITEFWATNSPPDNDETKPEHPHPVTPAKSTETPDDAAVAIRHRQTLALFRTWLFIVFLLGFIGGLCTYSFFSGIRRAPEAAGSAKSGVSLDNFVTGKLFYRGFNDERVPDADAVVLFLPMDRVPPIPLSIEGIRSDTIQNGSDDPAQQIAEIDGLFCRTGADGVFSMPYKKPGRYLAVLISSHAKRQEPDVDAVTIRELRRFFRLPQDLLGDFCFIREEYEFEQGKYIVRETF